MKPTIAQIIALWRKLSPLLLGDGSGGRTRPGAGRPLRYICIGG